jgi:hypothetical protein
MVLCTVIGVLMYYIGRLDFWWSGSSAGAAPGSALLPLYLIFVLCWTFLLVFYFGNWPFNKMSQPGQGVMASLLALVLAGITYYIFDHMARWAGLIFPIGVAWLIWIFSLGPFAGNPIVTAYEGKQPVSGISGFIATLGFTLVTVWIIPEQWMGIAVGFPFVWFLAAVWFFMLWPTWPLPKGPLTVQWVTRLGYFGFFSFVLLWILSAVGLNFFADSRAAGLGLVYLLALLAPVGLFQYWPFHNMGEVSRGWTWFIITAIVGIVVYWIINSFAPAERALYDAQVVTWGLALFAGFWFYTMLLGGAGAPPPGSE